MHIKDEYKYVLSLSSKEQKIYLKDNEFRKRLFTEEGHYPFVLLVQRLKGDALLSLLDNNLIELLEKDSRIEGKLYAIITCINPYNNIFLKNKRIIKLIYENKIVLNSYLGLLDITFGSSYFNYLIEIKNLETFENLHPNVQLEILKYQSNLDKINNLNPTYEFLFDLNKEVIEYLLNDNFFKNMFLNMTISNIAYIIKKGVVIPIDLINSDTLINKYVSIDNIPMFLEFLLDLDICNSYFKNIIKEKKKKQYDEMIKKGIINSDKLLEIIIAFNYEDISYNFLKNVESILNYIKQINKIIIPSDRYKIYNKLIHFHTLTVEEKNNLYEEISHNKNAMEFFYDDFKTCLNDSYNRIKTSLFSVDDLNRSSKSNEYGIDVYELNGEKFKMLVSHTTMEREDIEHFDTWNTQKEYASLSMIGDACLGTFRNPSIYVILGFTDLDYRNIAHIYHSDSHSNEEEGSKKVLELYTPDNLLKNTRGYNEILIKNSNHMKPSYIVCYDEIKIGDIVASKSLGNIPLVLIHTKKYNNEKTTIDLNNNDYISYAEASIMSSKGR